MLAQPYCDFGQFTIAAIVPCHNEEQAIAKVVSDLRNAVPGIDVYVYDNCSDDATAERALAAGAIVRAEHRKGKGNVVRRAFADIEADIYLLIDGDDTYDASAAPRLISCLIDGPYDHVLGTRRVVDGAAKAYRPAHLAGNRALNKIVSGIFGTDTGDLLSGYRVFSRRFVKSFPAVSREFEIETELTVHSLALRVPSETVPVGFRERAEGSESKLRTFRDGAKILSLILNLARHERPLSFYAIVGLIAGVTGLGLAIPVFIQYLSSGMVPRFPTLIGSVALVGCAVLLVVAGLILDGTRKTRNELSRLIYLSLPVTTRATAERERGQPVLVRASLRNQPTGTTAHGRLDSQLRPGSRSTTR